ncbi:MAG: alpha/beta fold hydrolase [Flavisolibacter sp.]|nr:alpha/beta fold hydrolase [Flavisolibacter sp.]
MASVPPQLKADSIFSHKIDSSFQTLCGYLIVPENRKKVSSKMIKLPFIVLKSKNPDKKKDPFLFTTGGPGGSSLAWINGMPSSSVIESRDCIAFEQRGTHFAIPNLRSFELDTALRESYRKNLNKDSMWLEGVKRYKKKLERKGIDLSGYNTDETIADIIDLLKVLKIDSVNLLGGSYSGGLMLAVLKKDPSKVRSLVLDSPLPNFVPIDEDEPMNFMKAIQVLSLHCDKDSSDRGRYGNLKAKFDEYFNLIKDRKFYFPYVERGKVDTLQIEYTKNELLDVICNTLQNSSAIKDVPFMIAEMINGNHAPYIRKKLDDIFNRNIAPNGMRMSVYCADQASYHREEVIRQLWQLYPLLKGWRINDVYNAVCDYWKVPPLSVQTKQPFYSNKPLLMGDGEMDPACTPIYMSMIKHYMPNSQCFLFTDKSHGVGGTTFRQMTQKFLDHPYNKIESPNEKIIAY